MSEKYPTCVHISALVLFFVIRTVASFEVVPIWLNIEHYSGSSRCRRTTFLWASFSILGTSKSRRELCRDCTELVKLYNLVFRQKLLHNVRWMRWRVIVVKEPITAWPETRSFSSHGITQSFQNFVRSSDLLEQIRTAQHPHNRKK